MIHLINTSKRASGELIITDDNGNETVKETMKCCHCQYTWILERGSGRVRGFCTKCNDVTCGSKECMSCIPFQKKLGYE